MEVDEFRRRGKEMVDFIADYLENINKRKVVPNIEPGYLRSLVSLDPPKSSENWDEIMKDIEEKIMPGITHWQHSKFHAYFPAGNSFPSILGDMLSTGLGINGFSWQASPACTELETIVMHWMGTMAGLPKHLLPFEDLNTEKLIDTDAALNENLNEQTETVQTSNTFGNLHWGGGVLLGSASECVLVSMLAARGKAISKYKRQHGSKEDGKILAKLVAYTSKLAHSCVEKAAMICLVKIRLVETDEDYSMRGDALKKAMENDRAKNLIPFYVCGTFGTTSCCSFDNLKEIGSICNEMDIYLHVDAAYAGNALICEELRPLMKGIEHVDSFSFNPNKWMLINYDASCLWVKDKYILTKALSIDPVYLQYRQMDKAIDYRNWGISLSRRFRSLKLWFTIRSYGVNGIQDYIRHHVALVKDFEKLVSSDERFEIIGKVTLGLVCFRLKGPEILSKNLLFLLNDSGDIHMTPTIVNEKYIIRFCVNAKQATLNDIQTSWELIKEAADKTYFEYHQRFKVINSDTRFNSNNDDSDMMDDEDNVANLSIIKLRRKTFTRIVSEPAKPSQAFSLTMRSNAATDFQLINNCGNNFIKTKSLDLMQELGTYDENNEVSINEA